MEKINGFLQFLVMLGALMSLLGLIEIQAYRTVDREAIERATEGELSLAGEWIVKETAVTTNYRLVLHF
ncbi:MAG: hypothetical protein R3B74_04920 [Nitrospirales bacterium]|nr:hypothetical protein [Nitrospirales bacterium]